LRAGGRRGLVPGPPPAGTGAGHAPADGAVLAADRAGTGRSRPVQDPPAARSRLGPCVPRLPVVADHALGGLCRRGGPPPALGPGAQTRRGAGTGRRPGRVPRKLGDLLTLSPVFSGLSSA